VHFWFKPDIHLIPLNAHLRGVAIIEFCHWVAMLWICSVFS
jgi:hypothetical protein